MLLGLDLSFSFVLNKHYIERVFWVSGSYLTLLAFFH